MDEDIPPTNATAHDPYTCLVPDTDCPYTCEGLTQCSDCNCAVIASGTGPWGKVADVIFCLLPILFLVLVTVPPRWMLKKPMSTARSLPLSALALFLVRLMYLGSDPLLVCASVIKGVHEALTPLSIMAGAICLFETMEATRCLPYMMREMKALTGGHPVAELCVIYCFAMMVEGASGFGTPVALGAPMLISLGHPKFESVIVLLLSNTFATVFGAAGTPIWYGFGALGLSPSDMNQISSNAAVGLVVAAFVLVPFIFAIIVSIEPIKENWLFLVLSLCGTMLPLLGISFVSYEFPSLLGGIIGLGITAVLVQCKVGLKPVDNSRSVCESSHPMDIAPISESSVVASSSPFMSKNEQDEEHVPLTTEGASFSLMSDADETDLAPEHRIEDATESQRAVEMALGPRKSGLEYVKEFALRTSPITLTVFFLILTRTIGPLNALLRKTEPSFAIHFGSYATFQLSASLVMELRNILTYPNMNWKYELLYTPFLIPFVLVSVITYLIYRKESLDTMGGIFGTVYDRVKGPSIALVGALTLVQLMVTGENESAPATIIGIVLSDAFEGGWIAISASIGALGSFFSGSTTVSNLTFGNVQQIAAERIGVSANAMLALQVVGASAGNGICLNNIIAACTVTGLVGIGEGKIIAKTVKFVMIFIVLATLVMLPFLFQ